LNPWPLALLFMARTSTPWNLLPAKELGCGSATPFAVALTAANAHDSTMLGAVVDDIPPIRMPTRRQRRRPGTVHADKGYDYPRCRGVAPPWDHPPHRPAWGGVLAAAGAAPLEG
jgi:Transposase DDE domain